MRYLASLVLALGVIGCGQGLGPVDGTGGNGGSAGQEFPCTEQGIRDAISEGGGPHTFDCDGPETVATTETLFIDKDVILDGGGNLTVDGDQDHTVFAVPSETLELRGLTVTGGSADEGGGINACGPPMSFASGALTLVDSTVTGNAASGVGGGIHCGDPLTLINSTVSDNAAESGGGIMFGENVTLINSTVSGNTAVADGGGILISYGEALTLVNTTVSGNTAGERGSAIFAHDTPLALVNSTVVGDVHSADLAALTAFGSVIRGACSEDGSQGPPQTSDGYNIESPGDTCYFDHSSDRVDVSEDDLQLGPLNDNGGPTDTHAIGAGSIAIDVIPEAECVDADGAPLNVDQRGEPRPVAILGTEPKCDVGAFELQP